MFAGGTRPSLSSPDTPRAMRHAGQVAHRQFNLPFNVTPTDYFADVCFLAYFRVAFVTDVYFCNWETIYVTFMIVQRKNVLVDLIAPSILQTKLCSSTIAAYWYWLNTNFIYWCHIFSCTKKKRKETSIRGMLKLNNHTTLCQVRFQPFRRESEIFSTCPKTAETDKPQWSFWSVLNS